VRCGVGGVCAWVGWGGWGDLGGCVGCPWGRVAGWWGWVLWPGCVGGCVGGGGVGGGGGWSPPLSKKTYGFVVDDENPWSVLGLMSSNSDYINHALEYTVEIGGPHHRDCLMYLPERGLVRQLQAPRRPRCHICGQRGAVPCRMVSAMELMAEALEWAGQTAPEQALASSVFVGRQSSISAGESWRAVPVDSLARKSVLSGCVRKSLVVLERHACLPWEAVLMNLLSLLFLGTRHLLFFSVFPCLFSSLFAFAWSFLGTCRPSR